MTPFDAKQRAREYLLAINGDKATTAQMELLAQIFTAVRDEALEDVAERIADPSRFIPSHSETVEEIRYDIRALKAKGEKP